MLVDRWSTSCRIMSLTTGIVVVTCDCTPVLPRMASFVVPLVLRPVLVAGSIHRKFQQPVLDKHVVGSVPGLMLLCHQPLKNDVSYSCPSGVMN